MVTDSDKTDEYYIIVKHLADDKFVKETFNIDPFEKGLPISFSACYTHYGRLLNLENKFSDLLAVRLNLKLLNTIDPDGRYGYCKLNEVNFTK